MVAQPCLVSAMPCLGVAVLRAEAAPSLAPKTSAQKPHPEPRSKPRPAGKCGRCGQEAFSCSRRQLPDREERLSIVHLETVRPYRPLPIYREDTIVQHYMQPEEFRQFFDSAYGGAAKTEAEQESDARIAQVYDLFVDAKVMRR